MRLDSDGARRTRCQMLGFPLGPPLGSDGEFLKCARLEQMAHSWVQSLPRQTDISHSGDPSHPVQRTSSRCVPGDFI